MLPREFAQTELLPGVIERDNLQQFPAEQVKKMGEMGFLGMMVDPGVWGWRHGHAITMFWLWKSSAKLTLLPR